MKHQRALLKAVLVVLSLAAIASIGGGFVLGVGLLPFHWWAARSASAWGRLLWAGLAAVLVAESAWAGYFVLFAEEQPFIWLVPAMAFLITVITFLRLPGRKRALAASH